MTIKTVNLITLTLALSLTACAGMQEETSELEEELTSELDDSVALEFAEELAASDPEADLATPECVGDVPCPPQFSNCIFLDDFDCGDEFCRSPVPQCGNGDGTFIRVQHVYACFDNVGNQCIAIDQGRRLVECGC